MRTSTSRVQRMKALALGLVLAALGARGQVPADAYRVETVATPRGIAPEVSAIAFSADGKLFACFRRGYVYSMDPATFVTVPLALALVAMAATWIPARRAVRLDPKEALVAE